MNPCDQSIAERIWRVVASIPRGRVASYGQVAAVAGLPGYARQVGRVLGQLPRDSRLPWHRVVRANGQLATPGDRQRTRLEAEGVVFVKSNRISMREYGWTP